MVEPDRDDRGPQPQRGDVTHVGVDVDRAAEPDELDVAHRGPGAHGAVHVGDPHGAARRAHLDPQVCGDRQLVVDPAVLLEHQVAARRDDQPITVEAPLVARRLEPPGDL
ncbi:hypothetical protein GH723_18000 [Actinomarinicola tropica]|uniref:Uncharacterized protein n=1 Tax=Actinomarinicola tropica TaxID=2789776 RepID=A0A5Q2RJ02_9ACTN|nr:hypothetical protein GH723_18000 [Actinomarinicola tropica]